MTELLKELFCVSLRAIYILPRNPFLFPLLDPARCHTLNSSHRTISFHFFSLIAVIAHHGKSFTNALYLSQERFNLPGVIHWARTLFPTVLSGREMNSNWAVCLCRRNSWMKTVMMLQCGSDVSMLSVALFGDDYEGGRGNASLNKNSIVKFRVSKDVYLQFYCQKHENKSVEWIPWRECVFALLGKTNRAQHHSLFCVIERDFHFRCWI